MAIKIENLSYNIKYGLPVGSRVGFPSLGLGNNVDMILG
jgi:hypothetical protein